MTLQVYNDFLVFEKKEINFPGVLLCDYNEEIKRFLSGENNASNGLNEIFNQYGLNHDINSVEYICFDKKKKRYRINIKISREALKKLSIRINTSHDYLFYGKDFYLNKNESTTSIKEKYEKIIKVVRSFALLQLTWK